MKNAKIKDYKTTGAAWEAYLVPDGVWLALPLVPPSQNEYLRWHWSRRKRYLDELSENLTWLALAFHIPRFEQAVVHITYFFSDHRQRDKDNYNGKFILDALKHAGILLDDRSSLIKLPEPEFLVAQRRSRTEIWIITDGESEILENVAITKEIPPCANFKPNPEGGFHETIQTI